MVTDEKLQRFLLDVLFEHQYTRKSGQDQENYSNGFEYTGRTIENEIYDITSGQLP